MIRDLSIKILLVCSFLVSGLLPTMVVSLIGFATTKAELNQQAFRQLESVRNIKKEQITNFFSERINNISVFARNPYIVEAYKELKQAFENAGGVESSRFRGHLEEAYDAHPSYISVHDRYFPFFKHLIQQYGYYDLFLVDNRFGDTVFTVRKESDFGIRIGNVSSSLRDVWLKSTIKGDIALSDTRPYSPSNNAPAQFLAAPIRENGIIIGVVAVQISIESIDNIMKERSGMWQSGETYLVGPDKKMRSDSHMDSLNHSVYASFNGTVEKNGVDTAASREALQGITGAGTLINYRGEEVLSAYTPIEIAGVKWAMIAEIDKKEIEQEIAETLNTKITFLFITSAALLLLLSLIISITINKGIKNTIDQLEKMIKDVLNGNFRARGDAGSVGVDFRGVVRSANQLIDAFVGQWEEKKKLEDHILYTEKLKAIGTLAGGIAHDFNNILTSMFAYSHMVMADLPQTGPARENMGEILVAIRRAADLVDQILTFGRHVKTGDKIIEISDIISSTVKLLKATLPKNITIKFQPPGYKLHLKARKSQINQVVMNLCTNAIYAMLETGGVLEIMIERFVNTDEETFVLPKGDYLKLTVKDTGHGIDPDIRDRIFDPFFTGKPVGQGSGMGLSIVHGIVLNYSGRIEVESTPGKGATFYIYLPLAEPGLVPGGEPEAIEPLICAGKHILFIDDEAQICRSQSAILESYGCKVTAVTDSREVKKIFQENPGQYDLVITDLIMPHVNGIELAKILLRLQPGIPIILTTGYSNYNGLAVNDEIKETGITALLKKPYEKEQLLGLITQILKPGQ